MSKERSQPPTLAVFLLRHLCPKDNQEALIGDLLESFREGRSDGWFWRQVLIALLAGVSKGLRLHWPQICFAVVGTLNRARIVDHASARDRATQGSRHFTAMAFVHRI